MKTLQGAESTGKPQPKLETVFGNGGSRGKTAIGLEDNSHESEPGWVKIPFWFKLYLGIIKPHLCILLKAMDASERSRLLQEAGLSAYMRALLQLRWSCPGDDQLGDDDAKELVGLACRNANAFDRSLNHAEEQVLWRLWSARSMQKIIRSE